MTSPIAGEREAFEAWYVADAERQGISMPGGIAHLREGDGYGEHCVMLNGKWQSWQARAALLEPVGEGDAPLIERLKQEAQIHAQEARTANATIAEIYQIVTGKTGEPGNWHGAEPVRKCIEELRAAIAASPKSNGGMGS